MTTNTIVCTKCLRIYEEKHQTGKAVKCGFCDADSQHVRVYYNKTKTAVVEVLRSEIRQLTKIVIFADPSVLDVGNQ